ncbi:MAG TPA: AAA family ATPase [Streptosporangiaceae bacterium]|nr:AAA family ATPase [Streptosporangiaceae bacterium]
MLVEREGFLASLERLLDEALGGSGRLVFVGGEAGVGKTTLAMALAEAVSGPLVRRGSCDSVTTAEPLGPILDALPELAEAVDQDAGMSRLRLFQKVRDVLSESPMLLVLEDVHWADETTLDILRFLGRRLAGAELMILATFRSEELSRDHPLALVLGDLATLPGVVRVQLPPLSAAGVRQLLDAEGSDLEADAIFQRTGGNPFYVTEVLAAGAERVPATVRDAVLARVSRLSPAGREVAGVASVLGRRAGIGFLTAVSARPLAAVDECLARGILVTDGDAVGFRHDLARLAVEQSLPAAERASAHARALAQLLEQGSVDHRRLAHHAAGCGDREAVAGHAPLAAARAARLGAHREAAEHLQLALRYHETPDRERAGLLDQLSYECYLTDQIARARDSGLAALAIYEQEQDARSIGTSQRWLSRLTWFFGQNADSERYAAAAVTTLEQLGPGPGLAMAYSNLAQLRMLADNHTEALHWGGKAIEMARRFGDREAEMHALNNVGSVLAWEGELAEGRARLTQSLDMALADDAHEHAARAYTNLGSSHIERRSFREADRYLQAGISYCTDRDLDTWRLYMSAWLAHSLAEQGHYAAADRCLADVLRQPHVPPITQVCALTVAGVLAARRGQDGMGPLDQALPIAIQTGEYQRLLPVAIARAEAAWIAGRPTDVAADIDRAWHFAIAHPRRWELGELSWWLHLAGEHRRPCVPLASPFALMLSGEHRAAAGEWRDLGCPLWSAYALAFSPRLQDAQECLQILDGLGIPAVRHAVLRDRHARGLVVPRGPRAARRASPAGLTAREAEVLQLLTEGLSNAEAAERLFLSEKTVGHHVSAVLRKLGEPTRSRAVAKALRLGVIQPR